MEKSDPVLDTILQLIEEGKATAVDFNHLIAETTPESIRDRIRRRTLKSATKDHLDDKGHQSLKLPSFNKRVMPKRKPNNQQNHGRSKVGHRHSERTQSRQYTEEVKFIASKIGKIVEEKDLQGLDKLALSKIALRMMSLENIDRDWLYNIYMMGLKED